MQKREQQYIIHFISGETYDHWMPYEKDGDHRIVEWFIDKTVPDDAIMRIFSEFMGPLAYIRKGSIAWIEVGSNRRAE